jgi:hypothetical protein
MGQYPPMMMVGRGRGLVSIWVWHLVHTTMLSPFLFHIFTLGKNILFAFFCLEFYISVVEKGT